MGKDQAMNVEMVSQRKQFKFLSWYDVEEACFSIYKKMKEDNYCPDAIVGLLRGGVVPARLFADYFKIVLDFFALDVKFYDGVGNRKESPIIRYSFKHKDLKGKILIIDDIYDSGKTMNAVLGYLKGQNTTTATLFWKESAANKPDYYGNIVKEDEWLIFPWEMEEFREQANIQKAKENEQK